MKIFIEINRIASYMLIFIFIYLLKDIVKISYVNNAYCKMWHVFWNGWSIINKGSYLVSTVTREKTKFDLKEK